MGHSPAQPHDASDVLPIDPLNEIDTRKTVICTVVSVVSLFTSMWLLLVLFHFILDQEYDVKVAGRETLELNALRAMEHAELTKTEDLGNGLQRVSIDEAIKRLSAK